MLSKTLAGFVVSCCGLFETNGTGCGKRLRPAPSQADAQAQAIEQGWELIAGRFWRCPECLLAMDAAQSRDATLERIEAKLDLLIIYMHVREWQESVLTRIEAKLDLIIEYMHVREWVDAAKKEGHCE